MGPHDVQQNMLEPVQGALRDVRSVVTDPSPPYDLLCHTNALRRLKQHIDSLLQDFAALSDIVGGLWCYFPYNNDFMLRTDAGNIKYLAKKASRILQMPNEQGYGIECDVCSEDQSDSDSENLDEIPGPDFLEFGENFTAVETVNRLVFLFDQAKETIQHMRAILTTGIYAQSSTGFRFRVLVKGKTLSLKQTNTATEYHRQTHLREIRRGSVDCLCDQNTQTEVACEASKKQAKGQHLNREVTQVGRDIRWHGLNRERNNVRKPEERQTKENTAQSRGMRDQHYELVQTTFLNGPVRYVRSAVGEDILAASFAGGNLMVFQGQKTAESRVEVTGPHRSSQNSLFPFIITCVTITKDGRLAVSGDDEGVVRIWDVQKRILAGKERNAHDGRITVIALSPDEKKFVTGDNGGGVCLHNIQENDKVDYFEGAHTSAVSCVQISDEGNVLATASVDHNVHLWNVGNQTKLKDAIHTHQNEICSLAMTKEMSHLASGTPDGTIHVTDGIDGRKLRTLKANHAAVNSLVFCPTTQLLLAAGDDCAIRFWNIDKQMQHGTCLLGHMDPITSLSLSPTGQQLLSGSKDHTVRIWKPPISTDRQLAERIVVSAFASTPDGNRVIIGSPDGSVRFFHVSSATALPRPPHVHALAVSCVAITPDGAHAVSASRDSSIQLWHVTTSAAIPARPAWNRYGPAISAVAITADGARVYAGTTTGEAYKILAQDTDTGGVETPATCKHEMCITCVALSRDGTHQVSGSADCMVQMRIDEDEDEIELDGNTLAVGCVWVTGNGMFVTAGGDDGYVRVWERGLEEEVVVVWHGGRVTSVWVSDGGRWAASGGAEEVRVWDVKNRKCVREIEGSGGGALSGEGLRRLVSEMGLKEEEMEDKGDDEMEEKEAEAEEEREGDATKEGGMVVQEGEVGGLERVLRAGLGELEFESEVRTWVASTDGKGVWVLLWDGSMRLCSRGGGGDETVGEEEVL